MQRKGRRDVEAQRDGLGGTEKTMSFNQLFSNDQSRHLTSCLTRQF